MEIILANQFRNEAPRLEEWLRYHAELGVDRFVLADDGSTDASRDIAESTGLNVEFITPPSTCAVWSSDATEAYRGSDRLARSIVSSFKFIQGRVQSRNRDCALGFFDVDEFLFVPDRRPLREVLAEEIAGAKALVVPSYEVHSGMFTVGASWVTRQTTRSMSDKNRQQCTRHAVGKSFQNMQFDGHWERPDEEYGVHIHYGGMVSPTPSKALRFLHYRSPMYDFPFNSKLCDEDYPQVREISDRAG